MSMRDSPQLEKTTLFKLSEMQGLAWFEHIVLVSSNQD
jgi:hypothetical protein